MPRHPDLSPTTRTLSARVYSALLDRARARGGRIFPLQVGDTWRDPPACARAEAQRAADHPRLHGYAPVLGEPALLDAIEARLRSRHGEVVARDGLQVMLGATGGLAVVVDTLVDPGDEVIVLAPFWPLIRGMIASRGETAVEVPFCPWISISRNGFIRDISARRDEVAASPEVSASVLFLNVFELHHHLSRNFFRGCKAHPSITHPAT
jgi:aspartate/methionine/tyrosine aminotransferase